MSELKCCPFCSSNNIKVGSVGTSLGIDNYIKCVDCGAKIQKCSEYGIEHLKELWNRRTPMTNIVEKLEYEKERHEKDRAYWSDKPWKDSCVYNEYDMADRKIDCYDDAINIVKQEINNERRRYGRFNK